MVGRELMAWRPLGFVDCLKPLTPRKIRHKRGVFMVQSGETQYIAQIGAGLMIKLKGMSLFMTSGVGDTHLCLEYLSHWVNMRSYERLHQNQTDGYHFPTRSSFFRGIICSSRFPQSGCILLLKKAPGKQPFGIWDTLSDDEKEQI